MTEQNQLVLSPGAGDRTQDIAAILARFLQRFISLPVEAYILLPIWILHTYIHNMFEFTPYLNITSPEASCGKTTTGDALTALCHKATTPTCGTAAVLRRVIARYQPTLILDEWDSLTRQVREACGNFLNTGFKRGGTYMLFEKSTVIELSTFCPKALVGRATVRLAEATLTRCISITIHKSAAGDKLEKFRESHRCEAEVLRQMCQQWADEFRRKQVLVSPNFPESLDGRQQDICEVLLVIADELGGEWPKAVRKALTNLLASRQRNLHTPENELLRAVQKYVLENKLVEFLSRDFCQWANAQEETPWSEKSLTPLRLANMLRVYDIYPGQINRMVSGKQRNCRGYLVAAFQQAFDRYLEPVTSSAT
jgi:putative DNA primase/helicase